ncbi:MAG: LysR family transcriptional regulator [Alphaproteobacteria bacterium]|nr:LysR family transcriptional regulator [Alphaproteobacteria bacterium]
MEDPFHYLLPFLHTAEALSFRRAAQRLEVTPAAVSKSVRRLEEELGVRLLDRTTRRVALSAEGELFYRRVRAALDEVEAGHAQLAAARSEPQGPLTLSMSPVLGPLLSRRLPRLLHRHPRLQLRLQLTDRLTRLVDEGVDVAVRIGTLADSGLVGRRLMRTTLRTVAAPGYLLRLGVPAEPEDLLAHHCLKYRGPDGTLVDWRFLDRPGGEARVVRTPTALDADQGTLLLDAAEAGLGLVQAMDFMVRDRAREGRLVEVLQDHAAPGPPVHALCLPGRQHLPRVRVTLDFLVGVFAELNAQGGDTRQGSPQEPRSGKGL